MTRRAALTLVLAVASCTTETRVDERTVHGTALDHGRDLFSDPGASPSSLNRFACSTCHAATDADVGSRVLPGSVLAGSIKRPLFWAGQENDLLRSMNDCRYYFMAAQQPWTAADEEAKVMYLYLSSLPAQHATEVPFTVVRSVVDLPAGDANVGASVYASTCQPCHGELHTGDGRLTAAALRLPDDTLAEHATEFTPTEQRVVFVEKVRHGGFLGYGGYMPPFSIETMPDDKLAGLLSYFGLYP